MFKSLRSRLILSFLIVVFVTLTAAALTLFARLDSYRDDLNEGTLQQVAAPVYYNLTLFTPVNGETRAGQRLRRELAAYLELQRQEAGVIVLLLDEQGHIMQDTTTDPELAEEQFAVPEPATRGPTFSELPAEKHTTASGDDLVHVTVPTTRLVRAQPTGIYAIVVALPENARREMFGDLLGRLLLAGAVGLAAAGIAMTVLWASLYRPLGKVTSGVRAVAAGDFSQRVPEQGPTEVRELARDVNRMADSVQESQDTLRQFLANVSHEVKTPLTSIRGFSQAMLDGTMESPEERARAARVIDAESRRVLHLVGELLDLSRIESGQQRMEVADVRVGELLAHVDEVFSLRAAESGVTLAVRLPETEPVVAADFDRIEQVLGNLLDNAFRHTPRGGAIEAGVRAGPAGFAELYVSDDGAGIAEADLPHVFDRFYRSALGEPEMPGAGLGLAISREIVRAHGGAIRAAAREGGGSEFAFTLPLV